MRKKSTIKNPPKREICIKIAQNQLKEILITRKDVLAAYSDGSVGRGDMVPGSDIDIGIVVKNPNEPWHVSRIINKKHDILVEWAFIPKKRYTISEIITDAGFTNDIANAHIYYDPTGFLKGLKEKVLSKYKDKNRILKRAEKQVINAKKSLRSIESAIKNKSKNQVYENINPVVRSALGFPCAILNRPVTHSRSFIFAERACRELNIPEYKDMVLEFLGSKDLFKKDAQKLMKKARKIINLSALDRNNKITHLYHLHTSQYFIDIGLYREAIRSIFMWTSWTVFNTKVNSEIKKTWKGFLQTLKWFKWQDIENKVKTGRQIVGLCSDILRRKEFADKGQNRL